MNALRIYRLAVDAITRDFTSLLAALIRLGYDPADHAGSVAQLAEPVENLVRTTRGEVYDQAVQMLRATAADQGVDNPYVPTISEYPSSSAETILRESLRGSPTEATRVISQRLTQHVEAAGRQVMTRSVEDGKNPAEDEDFAHAEYTRLTPEEFRQLRDDEDYDVPLTPEEQDELADYEAAPTQPTTRRERNPTAGGVQPHAWARVLTGAENCGFCVMLASRGPVYTSAEDAGSLTASAALRDAGATPWVNTYHPNCDCMVVPVYDYGNWPGRDSYKKLEQLYYEVTDSEWEDDDGNTRHGIYYNRGPSPTVQRNYEQQYERYSEYALKRAEILKQRKRLHDQGVPDRDLPPLPAEVPHPTSNQIIAAIDRRLKQMQRDGQTLPVDDVRAGQ